MTDDDEDHGDNRPEDMKIDDTILKLAEQYVGLENRARQINKDKAAIREQADKIGVPSLAWQVGVRMVKIMDVKERADFSRGFKRVTSVLSKAAETLFPEDLARQEKRRAREAEAKAKALAAAGKDTPEQQERRLAADSNPRNNPKRGGAGGVNGRKRAATIKEAAAQSDAALAESIASVQAKEQAEGAAILDGAIDGIKDGQGLTGKIGMGSVADEVPLAQSEIARQKLADAGLD
jgi:hypothetical protein